MNFNLIVNQCVKYFVLYSVAYINGLLVEKKGMKVNYTRKINHFVLFFITFFLDDIIPYTNNMVLKYIMSSLGILSYIIYIKPFRERSSFLNTMFSSFDRPEDRPHTLKWLWTQTFITFLVIIPISIYLTTVGLEDLIYIPVFINAIGDGLAEPIGVRFGRHKYKVRALFGKSNKKYIRSFEGSACVLLTSIIVLVIYLPFFTPTQAIFVMITMPIGMTLAEAFSPHTWDSPFLYGVCGILLFTTIQFF